MEATTNGQEHPSTALAQPGPNQVSRQEFGGVSLTHTNQATAALAAKAKADIEARFTMAMHRPRSWDQVRTSIMKECARPGFARAAIYAKPIGNTKIEGLSIRFAEVAVRCLGNVAIDQAQIYEDDRTRIVRIAVTDLESNTTWPADVTIAKTVERKQLKRGQQPIGQRVNSYGDPVYIVEATDDDVATKQAALISKAVRTLILRIVPGHIQDEAFDMCKAIARDENARDPDAARNAMCDAFASMGVQPTQLEQWLGHELSTATPSEIDELRHLFTAIRDGETTWHDALTNVLDGRVRTPTATPPAQQTAPTTQAAPPSEPPKKPRGTAGLKDKLAAEASKPAGPEKPAEPTPPGSFEGTVNAAKEAYDRAVEKARAKEAEKNAAKHPEAQPVDAAPVVEVVDPRCIKCGVPVIEPGQCYACSQS